jgi:TolB-like protein/DNA-binding winged helix-turn-helix (wHTH) protein
MNISREFSIKDGISDMQAEGLLKIGEWIVSPDCNSMTRGALCHHLEPKTMAVLTELARQPNKVVNRSEILDKVWPRTFSGDEALSRCVSQLRSFFEDDSRDPHYIETIPKKGYRLVATCESLINESGEKLPLASDHRSPAQGETEPPSPSRRLKPAARKLHTTQFLVLLGAVAILLKIGAMGIQSFSSSNDSVRISTIQAPAHSVFVLPFSNLTGHPDDDSFAEGIATTIRSEASKNGDIVVIANSSFHPDEADLGNIRALASEIGAATVLTGSVQRSVDELRITAQLADGYSGFSIWSKSFDLTDDDIFSVQDEIATSVVYEIRNSLLDSSTAAIEQAQAESR